MESPSFRTSFKILKSSPVKGWAILGTCEQSKIDVWENWVHYNFLCASDIVLMQKYEFFGPQKPQSCDA